MGKTIPVTKTNSPFQSIIFSIVDIVKIMIHQMLPKDKMGQEDKVRRLTFLIGFARNVCKPYAVVLTHSLVVMIMRTKTVSCYKWLTVLIIETLKVEKHLKHSPVKSSCCFRNFSGKRWSSARVVHDNGYVGIFLSKAIFGGPFLLSKPHKVNLYQQRRSQQYWRRLTTSSALCVQDHSRCHRKSKDWLDHWS